MPHRCPFGGLITCRRSAALQMVCYIPRSPFCLSDCGSYAFGGNLIGIEVALSCTGALSLLLFEAQNPGDEIFDVRVRHLNVGRHWNLAPDAHATLLDLVGELRHRTLVALVLGRDILICRTDDFLVDGMTRCTAVLLHHRLRRGVVERGIGRVRGEESQDQESAIPKRITCHASSSQCDGTVANNLRRRIKQNRRPWYRKP